MVLKFELGTVLGQHSKALAGAKRGKDKIDLTLNFRFCFPFGRPEGALKSTLSLLERVKLDPAATTLLIVVAGSDEGHIDPGSPK